MRPAAAIFPPRSREGRVDAPLLRALARALAQLGDIELPDSTPTADDVQRLEAAAPLYLAHELEQAGLLRTAGLVAGLFASGAITQPLGPTAALIADFWKGRRERLDDAEREQLFAQVFEPQGFEPLMHALCDALASLLDHPPRPQDIHARIALNEAADALGAWLAPRTGGMALFAANDIVQAIAQATRFLRDRLLQTAFGVHDLWGLVGAVGSAQGTDPSQVRRHVERGRHGAAVLEWLAAGVATGHAIDPAGADGQRVMAAAHAWRRAAHALQAASAESR